MKKSLALACAVSAVGVFGASSATAATPDSPSAEGLRANAPSSAPDVSSGGRYVAFSSLATDLTVGDTNGKADIFLRDTTFRKTVLVSKSYTGGAANGASTEPQVSEDGRYVVYMSDASNLVPGDTNRKTDIFRTDLSTGKTTRVSTSQTGVQSNGVSKRPRINSTATVIAFVSTATNLVKGDTNRIQDVFVRTLSNNAVKRISVTPAGGQLSSQSFSPSVSFDGKIVGFHADAFSDSTVNAWCGRTSDALSVIMKWTAATSKTSITEVVCRSSTREWVQEPRANMLGGVGFAKASDYGYTTFAARGTDGLSQDFWEGSSYSKAYWDVGRWGAVMAITNSDSNYLYVYDKYGYESGLSGGFDAVSMSPDGASIAVQRRSDRQIYLWNWQTGAYTLVSTR